MAPPLSSSDLSFSSSSSSSYGQPAAWIETGEWAHASFAKCYAFASPSSSSSSSIPDPDPFFSLPFPRPLSSPEESTHSSTALVPVKRGIIFNPSFTVDKDNYYVFNSWTCPGSRKISVTSYCTSAGNEEGTDIQMNTVFFRSASPANARVPTANEFNDVWFAYDEMYTDSRLALERMYDTCDNRERIFYPDPPKDRVYWRTVPILGVINPQPSPTGKQGIDYSAAVYNLFLDDDVRDLTGTESISLGNEFATLPNITIWPIKSAPMINTLALAACKGINAFGMRLLAAKLSVPANPLENCIDIVAGALVDWRTIFNEGGAAILPNQYLRKYVPTFIAVRTIWFNPELDQKVRWGEECEYECDEKLDCSGNGICSPIDGKCMCVPPFLGKRCACWPLKCGSLTQGTCDENTGGCKCFPGWGGPSCTKAVPVKCPQGRFPTAIGEKNCDVECSRFKTCSRHGKCSPTGKCVCDQGYYGPNCAVFCDPAATCMGRGSCGEDGMCICDSTLLVGPRCNCETQSVCAPDGECSKDQTRPDGGPLCKCKEGFYTDPDLATGKQCTVECSPATTCPSTRGTCDKDTGKCKCLPGFYGPGCANECGCDPAHGRCDPDTGCVCDPGWGDVKCDYECDAVTLCSGNGKCMRSGSCVCNPGFTGAQCETFCNAKETCTGNGICLPNGKCQCTEGYAYPSCRYKCGDDSPDRMRVCAGNGKCDVSGPEAGRCKCFPGFVGEFCDIKCDPIVNCSGGRGKCRADGDGCDCDPEKHTGKFCEFDILACAKTCKNGECTLAGCVCNPGYVGTNCDTKCEDCPGGACGESGECVCSFGRRLNDAGCVDQADPGVYLVPATEIPDICLGVKCQTHAVCDRTSGRCRCETGWFPEFECTQLCRASGSNLVLSQVSGKCIEDFTLAQYVLVFGILSTIVVMIAIVVFIPEIIAGPLDMVLYFGIIGLLALFFYFYVFIQ